jgi:hypothetical protein
MLRFLGFLRSLGVVLGLEILIILLLVTGPTMLAEGKIDDLEATSQAWLPLIRHDPTPTAVPTPTLSPSDYQALLQITPTGGINASTFNSGSFILRNNSTNGRRIEVLRIDLSTAVFPDMIFDPYGQGGDTLAKDLKVDQKGSAGFVGHSFEGEHGGGYDLLELRFNSFDPSDEFRFSVDVDPNSIRGVGAPGPNESGSVSGLELAGSTVSIRFDDGKTLSNQTFRIPGSDSGSQAALRDGLPPGPQLHMFGINTTPATVTLDEQTAQIRGLAWQPAAVLVLEGGLFLDGVPGGGFNVKPYDANSLVSVQQIDLQTLYNGHGTIPLKLSKTVPQAGINYLLSAFDNHYGDKGNTSNIIILDLNP